MAMARMTVTEALSRIKLLQKQIAQADKNVADFIARPRDKVDRMQDYSGGEAQYVSDQLNQIRDKESFLLRLRDAINASNMVTKITIKDETLTVAQWLVVKREILPGARTRAAARRQRLQQLHGMRMADRPLEARIPTVVDWVANISEVSISEMINRIDFLDGELDGALTQSNSTTFVEVSDQEIWHL